MTFRSKIMLTHRWVGIFLSALLLVQALTGTLLSFRDELEPVIHPSLRITRAAQQQPTQTLVDILRDLHSDYALVRFEFPKSDTIAAMARMRHESNGSVRYIAINPYSGEIIRDGGLMQWPIELLFQIHYTLVAGKTGHWIVGFGGISLFFLVLSGPYLWWPGLSRLKKSLKITTRFGYKRALREFHRVAGALAAAILLISASTGALLVWKSEFRAFLEWTGPLAHKPAPLIEVSKQHPLLPVDTLITKAQVEYGSTRLQQLRFPDGRTNTVTVFLEAERSMRPNASKQIWYNAYTGENLGDYVAGDLPVRNAIVDWLLQIHTGRFLSLPGRLLICLGGIALTLITLSGIWMWWSRSRMIRQRKKAKRSG